MSALELQAALGGLIEGGELAVEIQSIRAIDELWREAIAADRARAALTSGSALLVVILAGFGFFGTQRFIVSAGRREYAIRSAVGAGPRALGRLVLGRGLMLGLPGLVLGALLGFIVVACARSGSSSSCRASIVRTTPLWLE